MITDEQAEKANDFLRDTAARFAQAKANRVYLDEFRKTKKALLYQQHRGGTISDKESYAYAHPEYQELLEGIKAAVEEEETLRYQIIAAQAKIELYRTQAANNRRGF